MILEHLGKKPRIDASAYVAPTAVVCGDVTIAAGVRVLFGATLVAEGGSITLDENCIVLENAVVRSSARHSTHIARDCLIGPHAHVVGCTLEESVFVATGASVFHGATLGARSEVRINGVVHVRTQLPEGATVPIGWVAVGRPAEILPPDEHERIWAIQKPLDFPQTVYGVERPAAGESKMPAVARRLSELYRSHEDDKTL